MDVFAYPSVAYQWLMCKKKKKDGLEKMREEGLVTKKYHYYTLVASSANSGTLADQRSNKRKGREVVPIQQLEAMEYKMAAEQESNQNNGEEVEHDEMDLNSSQPTTVLADYYASQRTQRAMKRRKVSVIDRPIRQQQHSDTDFTDAEF
jgi:hypothetical protein